MMKVINGEIIEHSLPPVGTLKDGRTVSGYNLLDAATLKSEGWLPVEDIKPTFNEATQHLELTGYQVLADKVKVTYLVVDNPPPPPPEPDYDKEFRDAVSAATTLPELKAAILGNKGPGAQPKKGKSE